MRCRKPGVLERIIIVALLAVSCAAAEAPKKMELTRAARPWEFVSAVGQRAGVFGNEGGKLEAWVYPLKLFRDFHLLFHLQGRVIPAESLARSVRVRPEASTIIYSGDTFQVQETLFVPVAEPGAAIILEVETEEPLEIEAVFHRDFQLEWPAAFGGSYMNWDPKLRAFSFGEERKQYAGLVGSPTAEMVKEEWRNISPITRHQARVRSYWVRWRRAAVQSSSRSRGRCMGCRKRRQHIRR